MEKTAAVFTGKYYYKVISMYHDDQYFDSYFEAQKYIDKYGNLNDYIVSKPEIKNVLKKA